MVRKIRAPRIFFATAGLLVVHLALGCMSATRSSPNSTTSSLIGEWRQITLRVADESKACPTYFIVADGDQISCSAHDTVEFKPDGTFIAKFSGRDIQAIGSWRLNGSTLLISFAAPPEVAGINRSSTLEVGQDAKTITIRSNSDNMSIAETYVRD
jgi:hypothetical protein